MQDLRIVTKKGVILDGVCYDHPELQRYRVESARKTGYPSVIVRVEVRRHVGVLSGPYCHVRSLTGRLVCLAAPVVVTNPARQARAPEERRISPRDVQLPRPTA